MEAETDSPGLLIVTTMAVTVSSFLLPYADHFRSRGWKVGAMASGIENDHACAGHFDRVYGVEWSRDPLSFGTLAQMGPTVRLIREVVAREGYDIVHVHTPVAAFITRLALARPMEGVRPAVIYTAHGFHFQPGNRWYRNLVFTALEKLAGRWTDFLVTINRVDETAAVRLRLVPAERLRYMPGIGLDRSRFYPGAVPDSQLESLRQQFGIPRDAPIFVMIGELIGRKRHPDIVRAMAGMRNSRAHLILVGDGPLSGMISRLITSLGLSGRVHLAAYQDDVRPFVRLARAVVLTSSQEGLPRSVMEALSMGVPAICSDIRGNRELLSNGGGRLYPAGDIGALASCLNWFAEHPGEASAMGAGAVRHTSQYETSHIIALHDELYEIALAVRRGS